MEAVGGYSHKKMYLLHTVVSSYEAAEIIELMREQDPHIIINVLKTQNFLREFLSGADWVVRFEVLFRFRHSWGGRFMRFLKARVK